jgi:mono/diheme cytochrome c family protein
MAGDARKLTAVALTIVVLGMAAGAWAVEGGAIPEEARAKAIYVKQCASCHGAEGHGDGPAAYLLYPKPRDFWSARYRLVSTWEGVPTEDDTFGVITRGIPGSAMPAWGHLSESDRWALVRYVRGLAETPLVVAASKAPADGKPGTGLVVVPPEPADAATNVARGRALFVESCGSCHGAEGKGNPQKIMVDAENRPIQSRDFTSGVFKGDPSPEQLYRRILAGIPGTPMPNNDWAWGDDGWYLVRFVLGLSSPVQRARAEMRRFEIRAPRVERVPTNPDDGRWSASQPVALHLMPLWWRYDRPEEITVRALHDGAELAVLMQWTDDTHDSTAMRPQDFRDAAAIEFALQPDPPFFAMGETAAPVNIWMWKAERQADLEPAFQDLEKVYPNLGIDSYPNPLRGPLEQPHRHSLTLDSAPLFVTAWGAGNIVADPTRKAAAEDLRAEGFGTLRARPRPDQSVLSDAVWGTDTYRVVLRRTLAPAGVDAVTLAPGAVVPLAFAVWDGAAGDRDGKKSVTIWQELRLVE